MTLSTMSAPNEVLVPAITERRDPRQTLFEFLSHNHLRRGGNIMGSTHSRICRCDDGHSVCSIAGIQLVDQSEHTHKVNTEHRTFGFHTRTCKGPSSICLRSTGCGHALMDVRRDPNTEDLVRTIDA